MPWLTVKDTDLPPFEANQTYEVTSVELAEGKTSPPDFLSESELISLVRSLGIYNENSSKIHKKWQYEILWENIQLPCDKNRE